MKSLRISNRLKTQPMEDTSATVIISRPDFTDGVWSPIMGTTIESNSEFIPDVPTGGISRPGTLEIGQTYDVVIRGTQGIETLTFANNLTGLNPLGTGESSFRFIANNTNILLSNTLAVATVVTVLLIKQVL